MGSFVKLWLIDCDFNLPNVTVNLFSLIEILSPRIFFNEVFVLNRLGNWFAIQIKLLSIFIADVHCGVCLLLFVRD